MFYKDMCSLTKIHLQQLVALGSQGWGLGCIGESGHVLVLCANKVLCLVLAFLPGAWGFYLVVDKPAVCVFRGVILGVRLT
jgi:hypothetical protein